MPNETIALLLAPVQALARDTVVVVNARGALDTAAAVSTIVVGAFFLLLIPLLLLLILQVRKLSGTVKSLGEKGLRSTEPLLESGRAVADNVEFISMAVRTDVEHLTTSVKAVSERLREASDRMEQRVVEFNALMEVVQSEAEDIFVGTASTVRGVRAGARALGAGPRRRPGDGTGEGGVAGAQGVGNVYVSRPE